MCKHLALHNRFVKRADSITHDIIVKQHGGSIEVDTKLGEFAEVRLILPRMGALLSERQ